jgi:tetratricopeptide (TPR) repeat protein
MGRSKRATGYALAYLSLKDKLPRMTPFVLRAMGDVAYSERRYLDAASWYFKALNAFRFLGDDEQVVRSQLNLAWSYARAGRASDAAKHLPESVPASLEYLRLGANAIVAHAQGDWRAVITYGEAASRCPRPSHDLVDAAEACLLVAEAHQRLGDTTSAFTFLHNAAEFAARQARDASALLVLTLRAKGGDSPEQSASCGSGGYHPDACFTTGCA